jgi:hypothetical protein
MRDASEFAAFRDYLKTLKNEKMFVGIGERR